MREKKAPAGSPGEAGPHSERRASAQSESDELEAARKLARMATLAAGSLQDLGGPLTYLVSNLEYLSSELGRHERDLPPGRVNELQQCLREALLGARRVRDLVRDVSVADAPPSRANVDLHRVLLGAVKIARTEIDHRARVITEFDAVPTVSANESRLSRLFLNLLINAAQAVAGDPGNEHVIRVVTRNDPRRLVVVEITDSGPGIAPEHIERLFEPFFTTKPASDGLGLGLSICRQIVEELGGSIAAESTLGRGATFRVTLPAGKGDGDPAGPYPNGSARPFTPSDPPVRRLPVRKLG